MGHKLKIFCDFDGTITLYDTWIEMGEFFIRDKEKWAEVIREFEALEIGARECFLKECSLIENFDLDKFNEIIDKQKIDPAFTCFKNFCDVNGFQITILSEGMDYYINRVLSNHNLEIPFYSNRVLSNHKFTIPYYANKFVLAGDKKSFSLEFPYSDSECTRCGCSKRNLLLNNTADDEISVFIGDGFSDVCAVHYADIVFAKKSLASYCWKNNITYFDFQNFSDITKKLEKIIQKKNLHQRQSARTKRRDVFMRG